MWSSILIKMSSNCNLFLCNLLLSYDCLVGLGTNEALDLGQCLRGYETGDAYSKDSFWVYIYICIRQVAKAVPHPEDPRRL